MAGWLAEIVGLFVVFVVAWWLFYTQKLSYSGLVEVAENIDASSCLLGGYVVRTGLSNLIT